jgi:hypothetical protein
MAVIPETRISTSADGSFTSGLPIWPSLGTLSLGMFSGTQPRKSLVDVKPRILWFRFTAGFYYEFFAGLCGPGFGVSMNLEGETTGNSLSLTVTEDEIQAGLAAGLEFSIGAVVKVETHTSFSSWKTNLDLEPEIDVDILGLIVDAIEWAMQEGGGEGEGEVEKIPDTIDYRGMLAHSSHSFGYTNSATAEPKFYLPIDFVPDVPVLEAINVALHALLGEFKMGPQLSFGTVVTAMVNSITIDGAKYTDIQASNGKLTGTTADPPPASPQKMQVELGYHAGWDFEIGFFAEVSVLKLFSLGGSFNISIVELIANLASKQDNRTTVHYHTLENDIGSTIVASASMVDGDPAGVRVVLEPVTA